MRASKPITRQGYRYFRCDQEGYEEPCSYEWREATRDYQSPSGENCPMCGTWTFPHDSQPDSTLPVDAMGNLICLP